MKSVFTLVSVFCGVLSLIVGIAVFFSWDGRNVTVAFLTIFFLAILPSTVIFRNHPRPLGVVQVIGSILLASISFFEEQTRGATLTFRQLLPFFVVTISGAALIAKSFSGKASQ